jgi:protein-S-isoprenylcysteine O-methyltransferase
VLLLESTYVIAGIAGIAMVVLGQTLRSAAMIQAATNFSHSVAFAKRDTHKLVTDGVYKYVFVHFFHVAAAE